MKKYSTIQIPINCSQKDLDYLYQCNKESARVWNECLRLNKQCYKEYGRNSDIKYLRDRIKGSFSSTVSAKAIQITIKKYLSAVTGIKQARKQGRTDEKYPYKEKKNYNTIWDYMMIKVDYEKGLLLLQKPKIVYYDEISKKNRRIIEKVKIKSKNLPPNIRYVELIYDNGLKLALNYYVEEKEEIKQRNNICGVDLGEIHAITSIDNNGNPLIITGRKIRSEHRLRNKELAKLQRRISKCTKGSRNYKKYIKAKIKLLSKSNAKLKNNLHKVSKYFMNYVEENNIGTVIVGDLSKFNMNLKQRKNKKGQNQRLTNWQHGKLKELLKQKLERINVKIEEQSEEYTSQTCPRCNHKHKPTGRNYVCPNCGFIWHRDLIGANGILSKYLYDKIKMLDMSYNKQTKYLRIDC